MYIFIKTTAMCLHKTLFLFIFISTLDFFSVGAQTLDWARQSGGDADTHAGSGIYDWHGNLYVSGSFGSYYPYHNVTCSFGNTILTGYHNEYFITKYDTSGNLKWAKPTDDLYTNKMATSPLGNLYVTGNFKDSKTLGNITVTSNGYGIYLAEYDADMNVIWAKNIGQSNIPYLGFRSENLITDSFGNIYIYGAIDSGNTVFFDSISIDKRGFIVKCDSSGNIIWGISTDNGYVFYDGGMIADKKGNVFITGSFNRGSMTLGNITLMTDSTASQFIAEIDPSGNVLWAKSEQMLSNTTYMAIDNSGYIYRTGDFRGIALFDSILLTFPGRTSFLVKYDSTGHVIWAKKFNTDGVCYPKSLTVDLNGNTYLTGTFHLSLSIDSNSFTGAPNGDNLFFVQFDSNGNVISAFSGPGYSYPTDVLTDGLGNCYLLGNFGDSITLGSVVLTGKQYYYTMFLAKFKPTHPIVNYPGEKVSFNLYPNPAVDKITLLHDEDFPISDVSVYDIMGRQIRNIEQQRISINSLEIRLPALRDGIYLLRAKDVKQMHSAPFTIKR